MGWSWKIGTVRGISVNVHATFLLVLGWIVVLPLLAGLAAGRVLTGAALVLLMFGCIVLHELGHALTAQHYGIRTKGITLYPIGGVAQLERIPREPRQELWIALAGPAVNVVIALALGLGISAAHYWGGGPPVRLEGGGLANQLLAVNLVLAAFNMLPAFPMDGGRVLRACLASRMEYSRATQIAARLGQGMSFLLGIAGLAYNPFLILMAFFVYVSAAEEAAAIQEERVVHDIEAQAAMMTHLEILTPVDPLSRAMEHLLASAQNDFPVLQADTLVGMLSRTALIEGLRQHGASAPVSQVMRRDPVGVAPGESIQAVLRLLRESESQSVPVLDGGKLVGLITLENIGELLMLRQALELHEHPKGAKPVRFEVGNARS